MNLDSFTRQYLETMLWSTNDESTPSGGRPLDDNYTIDDITPEALAQAVADCERFRAENAGALEAAEEWLAGRGGDGDATTTAAHLFWLNRNGHGCGFWEGDSEACESLSKACEAFGECWPYLGDNGQIYGLGETIERKPRKLDVSVSYSTLTEDSVSEGGHADHGWIDQTGNDRHSLTGDNGEFIIEQAQHGVYRWESLREALAFVADKCTHVETCWTPENNRCGMTLYGTGNTDDCEGDEIEVCYDLHIECKSLGTAMRLYRVLRANRVYFANMR